MLVVASHAPADRNEENVEANDDGVEQAVHDNLHLLNAVAQHPVRQEAEAEDGEVQCWVVMVHICDARHDDERQVVKEPSNDGIETGVMDLINLAAVELFVATLPAYKVPHDNEADDAQANGRAPVHERVAKEEVFYHVIVPAAHAEADMEDGPLPPLRSKVILLVRIGYESIVGSHHCDVKVDEVVEEGALVGASIGSRHYALC